MAEWFKAFNQQTRQFDAALDRALLGGRFSVNVSFAFVAGYQSAIEALFQPEQIALAAFCVSEKNGNHPRAIETCLSQNGTQTLLSGSKTFVSGAGDAQVLYIACQDKRSNEGLDAEGRPLMKVVKLDARQAGVEIHALPALGFVPDIAHGKVSLNEVAVTAEMILPGDGYRDYVKAFRSYEDVHVLAAITAYRLGAAIDGKWPEQSIEAHISLILALRALADMNLQQAPAHIALAAIRTQLEDLLSRSDEYFQTSNPQAYSGWQRDKRLLSVARQAHQKRTVSAWQRLFPS
jgi:hypothetical protein